VRERGPLITIFHVEDAVFATSGALPIVSFHIAGRGNLVLRYHLSDCPPLAAAQPGIDPALLASDTEWREDLDRA
jgi:hypothetical protein